MNPDGQAVGVLFVAKLHEQVLNTALVCVQAGAALMLYTVVTKPELNPGPQAAVVLGEVGAQGITTQLFEIVAHVPGVEVPSLQLVSVLDWLIPPE